MGRGRRGAAPCRAASARATRCGSRSAIRCTATTSRSETDAISAGLGWTCALDKEFTGAAELRRIKEEGPARRLVAFVMEEKAVPRQGMPIEGGGEVTSGTHSPMLDVGIGMGYVLSEPGRARDRARDRRARQAAPAHASSRSRSTTKEGELGGSAESYPEDLKYHPEHDWARIEGDEAVLGITWWAQDALGELVHFEAPAVGGTTTKDEPYGEVESVKAVSDVIAPLSGEILEVNQKAVDEPEIVNDDPYGEGWLVRIRLADPAEVDVLLDVDAYRALVAEQ